MKVFNKGARLFKFHGVDVKPDQFTDLTAVIGEDSRRKAQAEKLLADYPNELLAGENASADAKAAIGRAGVLEKENKTLRAQIEKLQKLLVATDATASETEAIARAEKAEARVEELEAQLRSALQPPASEIPDAPAAESAAQSAKKGARRQI